MAYIGISKEWSVNLVWWFVTVPFNRLKLSGNLYTNHYNNNKHCILSHSVIFSWLDNPSVRRPPHFRSFVTTLGRTSLHE